jgi:hypothetical protein
MRVGTDAFVRPAKAKRSADHGSKVETESISPQSKERMRPEKQSRMTRFHSEAKVCARERRPVPTGLFPIS